MKKSINYKTIRLPRGYLSWSQFDLFNRNEDAYIREYIQGEERRNGWAQERAMEFGKTIAQVLEGTDTDDDIVALMKATVPKYQKSEYEVKASLKAKGREVMLLGKLDSYEHTDIPKFLEYKTGKWKWTQEKANKHGQLLFYKVMLWINLGKIADSKLVWIPTEESDIGELCLSGEEPKVFDVTHTQADILSMMGKIIRTAERIEYLMDAEINDVFA